jgi:hypothetical protein
VLIDLSVVVLQEHLCKDQGTLKVRERGTTPAVEFGVQCVRDIERNKSLEIGIDLADVKT